MLEILNSYALGLIVPIMIISFGVLFLIYLGFFFVTKFKRVFSVLIHHRRGAGISPFRAMTVALAGTLGVGNIVGVSGAILLGGYGAVFWMWVSALAAMVLKYAEIVLAMLHRKRGTDGRLYGGAMYYIEACFKGKMGRRVGCVFALLCVINSLGMGCMLQVNSVSEAFSETLSVSPILVGIIMAILVGIVLWRGIHDISSLTGIVIPIVTVIYIILSGIVIFTYRENIGAAFDSIFRCAFGSNNVRSAPAGLWGYIMSGAVRYGTMRGLLSNEAGCGTAPMAHASTASNRAAEQGVWGIFEVFVDTILLCTLTALVIILTFGNEDISVYLGRETALVFSAFGRGVGPLYSRFTQIGLAVSIFFFAFSTVICWAYYGVNSIKYCIKNNRVDMVYKVVYFICTFLGALHVDSFVWQISDFSLGCMTVINLIVLLIMRREIKKETDRFLFE